MAAKRPLLALWPRLAARFFSASQVLVYHEWGYGARACCETALWQSSLALRASSLSNQDCGSDCQIWQGSAPVPDAMLANVPGHTPQRQQVTCDELAQVGSDETKVEAQVEIRSVETEATQQLNLAPSQRLNPMHRS